jgi:carbonic anhydrase
MKASYVETAVTPGIERIKLHNGLYADSFPAEDLGPAPELRVAIVTCMDCRLDVFTAFGLRRGQAHVIRNAGGVITDDVVRSLMISQRMLGTREIAVVHHTRCGMQGLGELELRRELQADTGQSPAFAIEAFDDPEQDVRQSIARLRSSPFIDHREGIRGFLFDVDRGRLLRVADDPR